MTYIPKFKPGDLVLPKAAFSFLTKIQLGVVVKTKMKWSGHLTGKVNQIYCFEDMKFLHVVDSEIEFYDEI